MAYSYPLQSLQDSCWFKLICGASFQHLPAIRNLTLAYALAGADCIDVAADPAVVAAARDGLRAMERLVRAQSDSLDHSSLTFNRRASTHLPWLMVSLNDGEDPHFRKVGFDPEHCPPDCHRPCERICPAQAIVFSSDLSPKTHSRSEQSGVIRDRCYGCGRCIPVCPIQHIEPQSYVVSSDVIAPSLLPLVDAIEIHTQIGRTEKFRSLWQGIRPHINHLKLVAVSCPDSPDEVASAEDAPSHRTNNGDRFIHYLRSLYHIMTDGEQQPLPGALVWQTDGRPMSGDIGKGTTHAAIRLAKKAIAAQLPGFVQLAGGTNDHTIPSLQNLGLWPHPSLAGVAYGSYARKLLNPILEALDDYQDAIPVNPNSHRQIPFPQHNSPLKHSCNEYSSNCLETVPDLLSEAVQRAASLIFPLKALTQGKGARSPLAATISVPMSGVQGTLYSGPSSHFRSSVHL